MRSPPAGDRAGPLARDLRRLRRLGEADDEGADGHEEDDGRQVATARGDITGSLATPAPLRIGEDERGRYGAPLAGFIAVDRALDEPEIAALARRALDGVSARRPEQ